MVTFLWCLAAVLGFLAIIFLRFAEKAKKDLSITSAYERKGSRSATQEDTSADVVSLGLSIFSMSGSLPLEKPRTKKAKPKGFYYTGWGRPRRAAIVDTLR